MKFGANSLRGLSDDMNMLLCEVLFLNSPVLEQGPKQLKALR